MKTLIFILLKILELIGLVGIYFSGCYIGNILDDYTGNGYIWYNYMNFWFFIAILFMISMLCIMLYFLGFYIVKYNKKLADFIYKKLKL